MFNLLKDTRVNCLSILVDMKLSKYLDLVQLAYAEVGGIEGQRAPLKTKTAITIRKRLVSDIGEGAVVPPVVIGILLPNKEYESINEKSQLKEVISKAGDAKGNRVSVIDGMQRTTAMLEAYGIDESIGANIIRVELWVSDNVSSLIYRMLVLNTGQVPWETGRQLETVYGQFLTQIEEHIGNEASIFKLNEKRRRSRAGQYQSKSIIELLLLFSSRKTEIDVKDKVAEDFARLDTIETTSHTKFMPYFLDTMKLFISLDKCVAQLDQAAENNIRLKSGKDLFSGFPAMAGFFSAVSVELFDEPGFSIDWNKAENDMQELKTSLGELTERMSKMNQTELADFLQLELLEERVQQRSSRVGQFERELFFRAFRSMFRNANRLESFEPCWKS